MKVHILSQGDHGIPYDINLIDDSKNPIDISSSNVKVYIVYPGNTKRTLDSALGEVTIVDAINGLIQFEISEADTTIEGDYSVYVELYAPDFEISTVNGSNYTVSPKNGGAL